MRYRHVVPRIAWLLVRGFFWRLWEKYVKRDFHPLVFFYVMGFIATVAGVLLGLVVVGYRIAGYSIPIATVVLVALLVISGLQFTLFAMWFDMESQQRPEVAQLASPPCLPPWSPAEPAFSARISATTCSSAATASSASTTSSAARSRTSSTSSDDAFRFVPHDVTEPFFIDEPLDFVYHFAALASPEDYLRMPLASLKVGSYGTHHMLGLAKFKRARFLTASTSEVYGDPQIHPQPETYWGHVNPIGPRGVYDEAKRYAEALTMAYHRPAGRRHGDRADLQHLRAPDAAERRPRGLELRAPGARRGAAHGVRRRLADAELLLTWTT